MNSLNSSVVSLLRAVRIPASVAALALFLSLAASASAQVVLASGLDNPRGLAIGGDGSVYITEAGSPFAADESTPVIMTTLGPAYYGTTGAITRWGSGTQTQIVSNLPMLYNAASQDVTGAHGIAVTDSGNVFFTIGLGGNPSLRTTPAFQSLATVMYLGSGSSTPVLFADLGAYESANNPAGGPVDSNPYHLSATANGIYVADAGANALLRVTVAGAISPVAVFPNLPSGAEAVPTSVIAHEDGTFYASQLTGFPFSVGAASLFEGSSARYSTLLTGFTNVIDMAEGPDGMLYLLEFAHNGILSGDPTGGLWRVDPETGARTLLMSEGLTSPTAVAVSSDGTIYVTNQGVGAGRGTLLAIAPVPEPSTYGVLALGLLALVVGHRGWIRRTRR